MSGSKSFQITAFGAAPSWVSSDYRINETPESLWFWLLTSASGVKGSNLSETGTGLSVGLKRFIEKIKQLKSTDAPFNPHHYIQLTVSTIITVAQRAHAVDKTIGST